MASKDTGFHSSDADWTRGRAQAVADAEALARWQIGMTRRVVLAALVASEPAPGSHQPPLPSSAAQGGEV